MRIRDITESKTKLNEAVWFIPLIVAATRVGGGMLIKQMAKKGAQEVAKKGAAQATKQAAKKTAQAAAKAPKAVKDIGVGIGVGSGGMAAYEVASILGDAYDTLKEVFSDIELADIAKVVKDYGIPALAVVGLLYGGYKVYDYLSDTEDEEPAKEAKLPRQLKDPSKEVMVSKNGKTIVIDKDKEKDYLDKGWGLAEAATPDPKVVAKFADVDPKHRSYYIMKWAEEKGIDGDDAMELAGYEKDGYIGAGAWNWRYVGLDEAATPGATSAGAIASIASVPGAKRKVAKKGKYGAPEAPQVKNPDGTAKNALDVNKNIMGGKPIKR